MAGLGRKARIGILISVIWVVVVGVSNFNDAFTFVPYGYYVFSGPRMATFLLRVFVYGFVPLIVGWGIWWILRAKE